MRENRTYGLTRGKQSYMPRVDTLFLYSTGLNFLLLRQPRHSLVSNDFQLTSSANIYQPDSRFLRFSHKDVHSNPCPQKMLTLH